MPTPEDAIQRARTAYDAAADKYDSPALSFWNYFGCRTVARLNLRGGERILDVCSGSGASAIPAAEAVGPHGCVLAVDLAVRLLNLARSKAARAGLRNIEFRHGDMLALDESPASFDAVICVFGIFFVPDMAGAARELWRFVRPGGQLSITTWGANVFEPANSVFWNAIGRVRPDLHKAFNPWDRISEPVGLRQMLEEAGIDAPEIESEQKPHRLASFDDWWAIVRGSGYRGTLEQLNVSERESVRELNYSELQDRFPLEIQTDALFAIARKA